MVLNNNDNKSFTIKNLPLREKLSFRIASFLFITILFFQAITLVFNINKYEKDILNALGETARSTLTPLMHRTTAVNESPFKDTLTPDIFKKTILRGVTVYNMDKAIIGSYGEKTEATVNTKTGKFINKKRADDAEYYEALYTPPQINIPYYLIIRIDSSEIWAKIYDHLKEEIIELLFTSLFVTAVMMFVLREWLINPINLLHKNLIKAAENPEFPSIEETTKKYNDEINTAITIANNLIGQNANNIKRLKTQAEDKIHKLAYFDSVTGLPNRTYFLEQLEDLLHDKKFNRDFRLIVLSVDIDHFKDINDSMGHEIGDMLLEAVGKRLVKSLPDSAIISRASADEFLMMIELNRFHPDGSKIIEKIIETMDEPVSIIQERFQVHVSIGVSQYPEDAIEAKQLIKNADIALNRAKDEGRNTVRYYSEDFDLLIQRRFQLLRDLRIALEKEQLDLYYQPQIDLKTGELVGAEALLRWWKPGTKDEEGKFISPDQIIPIAEHSGLIVPIGEYVLRRACTVNKRWQDKGLPKFRVSVNLSWEQFHKCDLVKLVKEVLDETGLEPKYLELEVTESVFMENITAAVDILHQLNQIGVEIAIDDFGTGYSSLSYLRRLPIDRLKIDQSFIRDALVDKDDKIITKTIITLGHNLGLRVIAEGVETQEHENFLIEEGCDEVQGYKYSKALAENRFVEFIKNHDKNSIGIKEV